MEERTNTATFWNENLTDWLLVICCQLIFIGFVCSRALTSIGMIGLVSGALIFYRLETFNKYLARKELLIISLFFLIVLFSGIYSSDKTEWLTWVRIKLPYLFLPVAFAPLRKLDRRKFILVLYGFILTFFVSTSAVLANYFMHYQQINLSFLKGSAIPMPFSHIRYSLMLVMSFFCSIYLLVQSEYSISKIEKWLLAIYAAFAFVALHILTVRSGLIALYLGLMFLTTYYVIGQRKIVPAFLMLLLIILAPMVVYHTVPSFRNKLQYMDFDLYKYRHGSINNHSDAMRLLSMQIGLEIWKNNPLLGVGAGDLENATDTIYAAKYTDISIINRRIPHNQFIWVLASTGIIGLSLFLLAFFYPFIVKQHYKYWPLVILYIIIFSSFFTEDTLEEQMGTGFYLIFLLLFLNHLQQE